MSAEALKGRSLLTWKDYSSHEIMDLLALADTVKAEKREGIRRQRFSGHCLALLFEKRSTRTRCAFETAFGEEGGHPVFLSTQDIQLGGKESLEDTARVLGRMFDAIQFRGFKQQTAETLARYSGLPVFNGLTDLYHPTQALADLMTLREATGELKGSRLCYIGDGRNNVARSLMIICAKIGVHYVVISPPELAPDAETLDYCRPLAAVTGSELTVSSELDKVSGADALYTDVWVSMGEEALKEERRRLLEPYRVDSALMERTGKADSIFLHCLPAVKEEEVTAELIDGRRSRAWDQAENRKHTIKAIMLASLGLTS